MLGSKEPKPCWHRQEELYNSWDAEVHLHRRLFLGTVTLLSKLSCFDKNGVCTDVLGSRNVLPEIM